MTRTAHSGVLTAAAGVLVAVGMLLLIMVALVEPAGAAFPGKNGKIAYTGWDGHDLEIYTIKPGGGGRVKVTDNGTADFLPSWGSRP